MSKTRNGETTMFKKPLLIIAIVTLAVYGQVEQVEGRDPVKNLIRRATVRIIRSDGDGEGTGIITTIKNKKYILTANHVIKGTPWIRIQAVSGNSWANENRTAGWNDRYDIASIPLPRQLKHLPAIPLHDGQMARGEKVYLTGLPEGFYHITEGSVLGYDGAREEMWHNAASEQGSSGGGVVNIRGELCAIHTGAYAPGSRHYPNKTATPSFVMLRLIAVHYR